MGAKRIEVPEVLCVEWDASPAPEVRTVVMSPEEHEQHQREAAEAAQREAERIAYWSTS